MQRMSYCKSKLVHQFLRYDFANLKNDIFMRHPLLCLISVLLSSFFIRVSVKFYICATTDGLKKFMRLGVSLQKVYSSQPARIQVTKERQQYDANVPTRGRKGDYSYPLYYYTYNSIRYNVPSLLLYKFIHILRIKGEWKYLKF